MSRTNKVTRGKEAHDKTGTPPLSESAVANDKMLLARQPPKQHQPPRVFIV